MLLFLWSGLMQSMVSVDVEGGCVESHDLSIKSVANMASFNATGLSDSEARAAIEASLDKAGHAVLWEKMMEVAAAGPNEDNVHLFLTRSPMKKAKKVSFATAESKGYISRLKNYLGPRKEKLMRQALEVGSDATGPKPNYYTPIYDSDFMDRDVFVNFFLHADDERLSVIFSFNKSAIQADYFMAEFGKKFFD